MRNLSLLVGWALVVAACATPPTPATTPTPVSTPVAVTDTATVALPTLTQTITPIPSPTQTSTPVPPLVVHHWTQRDPLITMNLHWGDGGCTFVDALPANFTLLPNGNLYVLGFIGNTGMLQIKTTTLSRASTCQLLNSIDQAGFFDYDEHTYAIDHRTPPMIYGAGNTAISVQAWRSNAIDLYGVDAYIHFQEARDGLDKGDVCIECLSPEFPTILPALRNTDKLLSHFGPADLQPYQSGRVGIWMVPGTDSDKWSAVRWPLKSPSVAELASRMQYAAGNPVAILTGANAVEINRNFGRAISVCGMVVMNGFDIYRVFSRPLLPTEYGYSPLPKVSLSCSPSDGVLPMP